jgi:ATP-dependent RNA helicase DeaD
VKLLHEASGANSDEQEIPEVEPRKKRKPDKHGDKHGGKHAAKHDPGKKGPRPERSDGPTTKLYVGLGRADGVRPKDLVGAIANETYLSGRQIGPISIAETFSTVGVPSDAADAVIDAMKRTTIGGKRAKVRRDRHS